MNTVIDLLLILRIRGKIISMGYNTRGIENSTTIRSRVRTCTNTYNLLNLSFPDKTCNLTALTYFSRDDGRL